ncbi:right-handed parallel beta-helix repeat-containing protein [Kitasatospora cinereorecta]|uniref:PKD domain-containing protein n=1 Tax=Kitasatospora cinereorecta TaxID=285560 RepID=A0ABW0VIW6_9ACTN
MRLRQSLVLTAAVATAVAAVGLPATASAAAVTTLYVDKSESAHCSDGGSGTLAQPFCSVGAAAAVVQPGQTVLIAPGNYFEDEVHFTRSGTPDQPITFLGGPITKDATAMPVLQPGAGPEGGSFVLSHVHDVVIRGLRHYAKTNPVVITDSSRITVDQNWFQSSHGTADVRISGASDHVTVSRSVFPDTYGVAVDPGVHDTLITANDLSRTRTAAVTVKDAPGTAVTDNTILYSCLESVLIDGASPGAVVENNVISADHPAATKNYPSWCDAAHRGEAEISVSAASTAGSTVDYNTVHPWADAAGYRWAGTAHRTAAALKAATGQGSHDTDVDVAFGEGSAWPFHTLDTADAATLASLVDSADPAAPGTGTDLYGSKAVDDPAVAGTALGGGVRDRGAYEHTGLQGWLDLTDTPGPVPLTVKAVAQAHDSFGSPISYTFDFGDGTTPVVSTSPEVSHTYTTTGVHRVLVVISTAAGARVTPEPRFAVANAPGQLTADLTARQLDGGGLFEFAPTAESPWGGASTTVDFHDGNPPRTPQSNGTITYRFPQPGTYTVTMTAHDRVGHVVTTDKQVVVRYDTDHMALLPGERVQLVTRAGDTLMNTGANYTLGQWDTFDAMPLNGPSAPQAPARPSSLATTTTGDEYLRTFAVVDGRILSVDRNLGTTRPGGMGYVDRGFWFDWAEVTGAAGAGDLPGVTRVAAASIGNRTHVVALANGRVYEASGSHDSGTWSKWGDITAAVGLPGGVTSIAAGTTGNSLHVAALGADKHVRVADGNYDRGTWSAGDVTAAYGGPTGITQLAGATTPGSRFHVVVLANGVAYETTGDYAAGYWTGWGNISAASGLTGFSDVAAASTGNSLRLYGVYLGRVYNANGDYTRGQWSSWAEVTVPDAAGNTLPVGAIAAAGIG